MTNLVLIVRLAGQRVAIGAEAVSSVVELDEIAPVPRAAPHVSGLSALRSRVLTVIDGYRAVGLTGPAADNREAVVIDLDGHHYAITVDGVDDVVEATDADELARTPLKSEWAAVAAGAIEAEGDILLRIDVAALIAGPQALAA